ncbi:MAG: hypothetical protein ABIA08_02655 [bacterium]
MCFNLSKRTKVIFIVVVLLILLAGGFFYYWQNREIKGSPDDYVITETEQGKIVENEKAGFSVEVPKGWTPEKMKVEEGVISINSQDAEFEKKDNQIVLPLQKGCVINIEIIYRELTIDQLKDEVKYTHFLMGKIFDEFEEIDIDDFLALKNNFNTESSGETLAIYIPKENKIYSFFLFWGPNNEEFCTQAFNEFLEKISIK